LVTISLNTLGRFFFEHKIINYRFSYLLSDLQIASV
jgi:hypothetical protein